MATTDKISVKLEDSQLPTELKIALLKSHNLTWDEMYTAVLYRTTFASIATFLKSYESKDVEKVGFKAIDFGGGFIMGAIASYHAPEENSEEEEAKGSWSLEFTTEESDLAEIKLVFDSLNNEFSQIYERLLWDMCGGRFRNNDFRQVIFITVMDCLIEFMHKNCRDDGTEFEVILDNYFIATIGTDESGAKIMSVVPGSITKQLIKNDAVL